MIDKRTEEIECTLTQRGGKADHFLFANGNGRWIPHSHILEEYSREVSGESIKLTVSLWLYGKLGVD